MQIKPWGYWRPVLKMVQEYYPDFQPNKRLARDLFNIVVGVVWQVSLVLTPISLVTKEYPLLIGVVCCIALTSLILKFTWWNNLDEASKETLPADFDQRILGAPLGVVGQPVAGLDNGLATGKATVI